MLWARRSNGDLRATIYVWLALHLRDVPTSTERLIEFSAGVISAADVATVTVEAVRSGRFMVLPHAELLDMYRHKGGDYSRRDRQRRRRPSRLS